VFSCANSSARCPSDQRQLFPTACAKLSNGFALQMDEMRRPFPRRQTESDNQTDKQKDQYEHSTVPALPQRFLSGRASPKSHAKRKYVFRESVIRTCCTCSAGVYATQVASGTSVFHHRDRRQNRNTVILVLLDVDCFVVGFLLVDPRQLLARPARDSIYKAVEVIGRGARI